MDGRIILERIVWMAGQYWNRLYGWKDNIGTDCMDGRIILERIVWMKLYVHRRTIASCV